MPNWSDIRTTVLRGLKFPYLQVLDLRENLHLRTNPQKTASPFIVEGLDDHLGSYGKSGVHSATVL